jgi:hypothetical protein
MFILKKKMYKHRMLLLFLLQIALLILFLFIKKNNKIVIFDLLCDLPYKYDKKK